MWFALYLVLDAAIMAVMYLMSTIGGLGELRNIWIVGVIFLAGALIAATKRAGRQPAQPVPATASARAASSSKPAGTTKPRAASSKPAAAKPASTPSHRNGRKKH